MLLLGSEKNGTNRDGRRLREGMARRTPGRGDRRRVVIDPWGLWSGRRDSNPRQPAWKAGTLPTELLPRIGEEAGGQESRSETTSGVGVRGLEPPTSASQTPRATRLRHTPPSAHASEYSHRLELVSTQQPVAPGTARYSSSTPGPDRPICSYPVWLTRAVAIRR